MTELDKEAALCEQQVSYRSTDSLSQDASAMLHSPSSKFITSIACVAASLWFVFQLWALHLQFWSAPYLQNLGFQNPLLSGLQVRPLHLAFAIFLVFLMYPAFKRTSRNYIPIMDWSLALLGVICTGYIFLFLEYLAFTAHSGLPTDTQIYIGALGIVLLLEASRRVLGLAYTVFCSIFLLYAYIGNGFFIPDIMEHAGHSVATIINMQWLGNTGVFGILLGVPIIFVFYILLVSLLYASLIKTLDSYKQVPGKGIFFLKVITKPLVIVPGFVLIWWFLIADEQISERMVLFATILMILMIVLHGPIRALVGGQGNLTDQFIKGFVNLREGLIASVRNMIRLSVLAATLGIIIGTINTTPIVLVLLDFVDWARGDFV